MRLLKGTVRLSQMVRVFGSLHGHHGALVAARRDSGLVSWKRFDLTGH
jgi:hypothetical protein